MKLSDRNRLNHLVQERDRLRSQLQTLFEPDDIKIEIQGSKAQGVVRDRIIDAIRAGWHADLKENTDALEAIGVKVDDPPVMPFPKGHACRVAA